MKSYIKAIIIYEIGCSNKKQSENYLQKGKCDEKESIGVIYGS